MKKYLYLVLAFLLIIFSINGLAKTRVIHVVVALCDNKYQGISPVPAQLGNGQDPKNNLYWGAMYGVKTFIQKQPEWQLVSTIKNPQQAILERLIFKHQTEDAYMIADAYDGQYIKQTMQDFFNFSAGLSKKETTLNNQSIQFGGNANLVVFVGHNGLMDVPSLLFNSPVVTDDKVRRLNQQRDAAVFACRSQKYFTPRLEKIGINPLIMTTGNMAPEGYVLNALVKSWLKNKTPEQTKETIAQAYNQYQKSGINGARRLFTTH